LPYQLASNESFCEESLAKNRNVRPDSAAKSDLEKI